jgi:filamentous hemagglutinin
MGSNAPPATVGALKNVPKQANASVQQQGNNVSTASTGNSATNAEGVTLKDTRAATGVQIEPASATSQSTARDALQAEAPRNNLGTADTLLPEAEFAGRGTIRSDLNEHVNNAVVSGKQISGGHNMVEFNKTLEDAGGTIIYKKEVANGIFEIQYQLPNGSKVATKTVYDPEIYTNMPEMATMAANKALIQYQLTGKLAQKVTIDGIQFDVPIKIQNGVPYIATVFPIGVEK